MKTIHIITGYKGAIVAFADGRLARDITEKMCDPWNPRIESVKLIEDAYEGEEELACETER